MPPFLSVRTVGQAGIEKKLAGIDEALDNRGILDEGAAVLFNRMRTRFLDEVDPDGIAWPESRAAERRRVLNLGGGTLFDTGKLWRGIQLFADSPTSRAIGTNVTNDLDFPYPIIHQFGLGDQEQRVFLGFGQEDAEAMVEVVLNRLIQGLSA